MKATMNFKRRGMVICAQGHLHRSTTSAETCNSAWRYTMRKSLSTDELIIELVKILDKRKG
jgi:hypothetical protein